MPNTEAVDLAARKDIAILETLFEGHERACLERGRKAEKFEEDMRLYLTSLNVKIDHLVSGNNKFIQGIGMKVIAAGGAVIASLLIYIWQTHT